MTENTVDQALRHACQTISRLDADILLGNILGVSRSTLFAYPERPLTASDISRFNSAVTARAAGKPLAYLTGTREFWSLELLVTPDTLIPRPETECLVERTLQLVLTEYAVIADCGTGSGAIALALASERPGWQIHATDSSTAALEVAKKNAARLGISTVHFHQGNWCVALPPVKFDAIISNPPYIAENDSHLADLRFEPQHALISGKDGLDAIRVIAAEAKNYLQLDGVLLLEHGCDQATAVRDILQTEGYEDIVTQQDLAGSDRVTLGKFRRNINARKRLAQKNPWE